MLSFHDHEASNGLVNSAGLDLVKREEAIIPPSTLNLPVRSALPAQLPPAESPHRLSKLCRRWYSLCRRRPSSSDFSVNKQILFSILLNFCSFMELGAFESRPLLSWPIQIAQRCQRFLWSFLHALLGAWDQSLNVVNALESFFIAAGLLKKYRSLDVNNVTYLAIVVESEEASETNKIVELLRWLAAIGVKHVCLYDMEGVLKKSKADITEKSNAAWKEIDLSKPVSDLSSEPTLEFLSFSDGKEGIAKAANSLFLKHLESCKHGGDQQGLDYTEKLMDEALRTVGRRGPDPDLLLVYGPARCHLGFPPWRLRYTEIVHMGPLRSLRYGLLVKAIHRFTTVRQNFGS